MSIITLARRMGTSVQMIDQPYVHLARDAEDQDRGLLDLTRLLGTCGHDCRRQPTTDNVPENEKTPREAGLSVQRAREDSNL